MIMIELDEKIETQLESVVNFIGEVLIEEPSFLEIQSGEEQKEYLSVVKDLTGFSFSKIPETEFPGKIAAVDGGSGTVVSGHSFVVGAYRAAQVIFDRKQRISEYTIPLQVVAISSENKARIFENEYLRLTSTKPTEVPELDKILERLRLLAEWSLVKDILNRLNSGDILLIDGSLRSSAALPYSLLEDITRQASRKQVSLVGVSKTSTLFWGKNSPLIPMVVRIARKLSGLEKWFCRLSSSDTFTDPSWFGIIYVCKFKKSSDFAFRTDISRLEKNPPEIIFSILSECSSDPTFLGYPYPLAAAHSLSRVSLSELEDIRYRLQGMALEKGILQTDWDLLFTDFHDILNADLNR